MSNYGGTISDDIMPMPIKSAEIDFNHLRISYGSWVYEAESKDGFLYEGHYGRNQIDRNKVLRAWRHAGPTGSLVFYYEWQHESDQKDHGQGVIRLFPSDGPQDAIDDPVELSRAKQAVIESFARVAPNVEVPNLFVTDDRQTGRKLNYENRDRPGIYVLFYSSGKIARVGQAGPRGLSARLLDYEANKSGWFVFRWVAVAPFPDEHLRLITPIEDDLIATLRPPENSKGISQD